jgi:LytS/YehU family sensor histidine kinase
LRLGVTNTGAMDAPSESTGLGLSNLRARLAHLYRGAASLDLRADGPDRVIAELVLPVTPPAA